MDTKICTSGSRCLHPDGPILPIDQFSRDASKKDGRATQCKPCKRIKIKSWQQTNKNIMHIYGEIYRANHPGEARDRNRRWREKNPEKSRQKYRHWRNQNLERQRKREAEWRKSHPENTRQRSQRRRTQRRLLPATFTIRDWDNALDYWHHTCAYCGNTSTGVLQQDHFIPITGKGGYTRENIIPACSACNSQKHDLDPAKWTAKRFGEYEAEAILQAIAVYFEWVKSQGL